MTADSTKMTEQILPQKKRKKKKANLTTKKKKKEQLYTPLLSLCHHKSVSPTKHVDTVTKYQAKQCHDEKKKQEHLRTLEDVCDWILHRWGKEERQSRVVEVR